MILKSFEEYPKSTTLWGLQMIEKRGKNGVLDLFLHPKLLRPFFSDEILAAPPPSLCKNLQKTATYFAGIYNRKLYRKYVRS